MILCLSYYLLYIINNRNIYNKIQTLDMEYFAGKKIGDMMTRVMTDPGNINSIILEVFNMISL